MVSGESAATWAAECLRAPPARQLLFVYLANDIMQNSRRKGPEFTVAYGDRLQHIFPRVFAAAPHASGGGSAASTAAIGAGCTPPVVR